MNDSSRENLDNETDIAVKEIRRKAIKMDPAEALKKLLARLQEPNQKYFNFIVVEGDLELVDTDGKALDESGGTPTWLLRLPCFDSEMANQQIEVIHICHPLGLYEAIETNDPERTVIHCGYALEGACRRCKAVAPEKLEKKFETVRKLVSLGRSIS